MDEKETAKKNDAASTKKKSTQKPKLKRRVTFDSSAENMGNLTITQKVRVKKQKINCTINFTNICQIKETPMKSDVQKSNTSGDRIAPHCMRKFCKQKIIQHNEKAKVKEYPKVANSSKGKKRAHTKNSEKLLDSPKRFKSEDKHVSYEDISSDDILDSLYVDNKLETLIIRTKARERLSEANEASYPKPLCTSTPLREPADDYEDIVSSSANMDDSINSQDTLILEPKLELLSPQNQKEHCFDSCEQNFDPLEACFSSGFYQEFFHINENTPENLVISVDPFLASNRSEVFSQSDANQVFLDIKSLSPKNTIIPKEPAISCKQEHNQVSQEFLDNCVLSLKNFEEVSCITPCNQGSEDIVADYKTNVNQLFVDNKMESFPSSSKNTTHSKIKSHSDLEVIKHNAIIMNPTNLSCSGNKSNSQTLSSINLLSSENENNGLCTNVSFKFKKTTIERVEDYPEDTKTDSGIDFNQNSLDDKIPILSAIDNLFICKQDSDYVTADSEIKVNNLDFDKTVRSKEPVIACGQISHKNPEDSLNKIVFSNNSAVSNVSAFRKNDSEEEKCNYLSGINQVEPLVVQSLKLINAFSPNKLEILKGRPVVNHKHGSSENTRAVFENNVSQYNYRSGINLVKPLVVQSLNLINALSLNKLEIFEERYIVNRKQVSENIKPNFGNDVNQHSLSVYIYANYPKVFATSEEPAIDRVNHNSSSSYVKDEIESDIDRNLLDDKSLRPKYSKTSKENVQTSRDLHSEDLKTNNESAGNRVALEKNLLLSKTDELPVEPAVVRVYMAQNTKESIFNNDHHYENSDVSRLEINSDELKKPTEPSLGLNSKEPPAPRLEQNTRESPEPSLEHDSLEPTEISIAQNSRELSESIVKQNSIDPSELGLEQNSKELFESIFERNSKEPSKPNLEHVSAEPDVGSLKEICNRSSVGSFEHDNEEPALDNIEQIVKETAFAYLQNSKNSENITPDSISEVIQVDFEENPISHEHDVTEKFIKNVRSLKYNSKIFFPAAVVITEESTVIDLTKDFEETNTNTQQDSEIFEFEVKQAALGLKKGFNERLTASSKQCIDGKAADSGRNDRNIFSDKELARDNSMVRNHAMAIPDLNSKRNKRVDDKPKCIPTSPKIPSINNIKYKPETSSSSENLRSMSSTNRICTQTYNNEYLDRAIETQISALNQALYIQSVTHKYRPANMYGQQPYGTTYPYNNMHPVPSQFNIRRNNNGYNANRPYRNTPYHRPNLREIQIATRHIIDHTREKYRTRHTTTTGSIATPHAGVNLESETVKLPEPVSVKYEPNMMKQETTCNTEKKNFQVKRENLDSPEKKSFVANQSVMNNNLIRFIKKEPLD